MRTTSLAALALLIAGCGIDPAPTGPEDPGLILPEPELSLAEPELAAATVPTNVWTTRAPMPTPRLWLAAGAVNGVLYAVGGRGSDGRVLATVQAYTPGSNSWVTKAPLPSARGALNGTGTINGVLYVAGGVNSSNNDSNTLYAYSPSTEARPLSSSRNQPANAPLRRSSWPPLEAGMWRLYQGLGRLLLSWRPAGKL